MFKYLAPLALTVQFATPAYSDNHNDDFIQRPATDVEMNVCDADRDLSGQVYFLGSNGNVQRPVNVLMCYSSEVWEMNCDFAKAFSQITGGFIKRHQEENITAERNIDLGARSAAKSCEGLLFS